MTNAQKKTEKDFATFFEHMSLIIHEDMVKNGFWRGKKHKDDIQPYSPEEDLCRHMLMVTEIAEASEAVRKPDKQDDHLPQFPAEAVELADAVIRIMDYAAHKSIAEGWDLGNVILKKCEYNRSRPFKHGKQV
jgi:hypothetical protein